MGSWPPVAGTVPLNHTARSPKVSWWIDWFMVPFCFEFEIVVFKAGAVRGARPLDQGTIVPSVESRPMTLDGPLGVAAMTVTFPPDQLVIANGIVTTMGRLPSTAVPRDWD